MMHLTVLLLAATAATTPNFVILFLDDHGWGDIGANNPNTTETPHMDALAASGLRFTDFHAGASVCTPSRAALLTGRLGIRTGVFTNFGPNSMYGMPLEEKVLPQLLPPEYETHAIGKWHLGEDGPYSPTYRGFSSWYGLPYSGDMGCLGSTPRSCKPTHDRSKDSPECPALCNLVDDNVIAIPLFDCPAKNCSGNASCNGFIVQQPVVETELEEAYAHRAAAIIADAAAREASFLIYIGFNSPHTPLSYSDKWANASSRPGWRQVYGNSLAEVDYAVGLVVAALHDNKVADNTLVFLTSDNGPADLPVVDCDFKGEPGPFVGAWQKSATGGGGGATEKGTTWEGGHRLVGIASWPGHIQAGRTTDQLASQLDLVPTLVALAGGSLPTDRSYDGEDITHILLGGERQTSDTPRMLFHPSGNGVLNAMRYGSYKLFWETYAAQSCNHGSKGKTLKHDPPLVFDLSKDPAESTPVEAPAEVLSAASAGREAKLRDVNMTMRHTANYQKGGKESAPCCDLAAPHCQCQ